MGMYTGIRFKGYVKPEFRDEFESIALRGEWENHNDYVFNNFGKIGRSSFIPCGCLSYMPDEWEKYDDSLEKYSSEWFQSAKDADEFKREWDSTTGYWSFQCSLKNYESEIEQWFSILPYFIEKIDHLEYYYEEWDYSSKYDLIGNSIIKVDDKFVKYINY